MVTGSRLERKKYQASQQESTPLDSSENQGRQKKKGKKAGKKPLWRRILKYCLIAFFSLFILAVASGAAIFIYYSSSAPQITEADLVGQMPSKIYDQKGNLIKELGNQSRDLMQANEIPDNLKNAVIAIEDGRFYKHNGIDPIRIAGAFVRNIRRGRISEGGSTITQQLVKNSVFSTDFKDQTLKRKVQEAWLAMQLEREYTKDQILTFYLNKLFYSNNTYGAKTAARLFFGKELSQLTVGEAALLAGIPQAPSSYDPYAFPEAAQERRDTVLSVMLRRKLISQAQYDEAIAQSVSSMLKPLDQNTMDNTDMVLDSYLDVVAKEVKEKMNLDIFTDGVEVYTNLNWDAQKQAYDLVNNDSSLFPNDKMQTAISIVDVTNGQLQAVIGGRKQNVYLGLNRANTLNRSIGSTMKPLADYGPAFEYLNYSTGTTVVDEPYTYKNGGELQNFDFEYKGKMTLREALAGSRNIPALKMLHAVGMDNAYAFLQKLNINISNNDKKELVEANAIGGEVSPIQLSAAYAAIANYGEYHAPYAVRRVVTSAGTVRDFDSPGSRAMKDSTAYMLTDILKGVPGEFAAAAKLDGIPNAGKTGTTNYTAEQLRQLGLDASTYAAPDGWFAGFTTKYAMVTWVGYDNPYEAGNYLTLEQTRLPQQIYAKLMTSLMANQSKSDWTMPSSLVKADIEKYTEPLLLPGPYTPREMISSELFIKGSEPKEQSLNYGRHIAAPTGFDANYNQQTRTIHATWGPLTGSGTFELSVNGTVVYQGTGTSFDIPAHEIQDYVLRLRIVDGNSSSDTLVITVSLKSESSSSSSQPNPNEQGENNPQSPNNRGNQPNQPGQPGQPNQPGQNGNQPGNQNQPGQNGNTGHP